MGDVLLYSGERGMDDTSRKEDSSGTLGFFDFFDRGLDSDPDPAEKVSVSTQLEGLVRRGSWLWLGRKEEEMEFALVFDEVE